MKPQSKTSAALKQSKQESKFIVMPVSDDSVLPLCAEAPRTMRRPGGNAATAEEPFEIITSPDGVKRAELKEGYGWGDNATATFIRYHYSLLNRDIMRARTIFLQRCRKDAKATGDHVAVVLEDCPELRLLCTEEQVASVLNSHKQRVPGVEARGILEHLLPTCSATYIERMTRKATYKYQPKTNRTFRPKKP